MLTEYELELVQIAIPNEITFSRKKILKGDNTGFYTKRIVHLQSAYAKLTKPVFVPLGEL